jgi:hypothetical protein
VQNQQLGGRVYNRHARPLVHRAQHIAGIIQAQEGSSMVAASRLGGIARFPYMVKGTIQEKTTSFQKIYTSTVCLLNSLLYGPRVPKIIELYGV